MNLFKFKFDLKGSSNLIQTVTIPSDSKYSVGVKIVDGENEVVLDDTMKITIQDDKFIYTPTEIFNNYAVFACSTGSNAGESKSYQVNFHKDADEDIPEVNAIFKGFNVKTNDSKVSNWAITDSQMKIVYTDEWPELSSTADDRLIYFVVDKPTPPTPVPPKPVPPTPGDDRFVIGFLAQSESDEFDSNSVEDCLNKLFEPSIKYTRDNDDYYLKIKCTSTGSETQGDAAKVDQISPFFNWSTEDGKTYVEIEYTKITNNSLILGAFGKEVANYDEAQEWIAQYNLDRFGEDFSLPNTSNPIPEDIDDWTIVYEDTIPVEGIVITNDYAYVPGDEELEAPTIKYLLNSETYPQWTEVGPD